ncbi:hypothetical protein SNOG_10860 [Parastagonospora nodorum SN15]|uniref:Uncharacterized protein n=1 Tax=Phaeosphaeria nodorum (strain SN15 / ATCC MYA-4574 / FGSC 10173) TaxID=321614 RepID=Q0UBK4_PHANO|nr:hypothetical protein SNOG_10860 [Parastagonospora nodorum SN15]EAT81359.2 hypothetical protein SNOG_10860 [Parastagonospora nodorum SN15]
MPRHFRNTRRPAAFLHYPSQDTFSGRATRPRSTSPDMLRFAYGTRRRRPSPAPRRDEIEDLLSREMRAINEDMRRLRGLVALVHAPRLAIAHTFPIALTQPNAFRA